MRYLWRRVSLSGSTLSWVSIIFEGADKCLCTTPSFIVITNSGLEWCLFAFFNSWKCGCRGEGFGDDVDMLDEDRELEEGDEDKGEGEDISGLVIVLAMIVGFLGVGGVGSGFLGCRVGESGTSASITLSWDVAFKGGEEGSDKGGIEGGGCCGGNGGRGLCFGESFPTSMLRLTDTSISGFTSYLNGVTPFKSCEECLLIAADIYLISKQVWCLE